MGEQLTVLIVEDQWMFQDALRIVLEDESDIIVLPAATDAVGAMEAVDTHRPDVVVVDADSRAVAGFGLARAILRARPQTKIVMMSSLPDYELDRRGVEAGANEVISRQQAAADLSSVLRAVMHER